MSYKSNSKSYQEYLRWKFEFEKQTKEQLYQKSLSHYRLNVLPAYLSNRGAWRNYKYDEFRKFKWHLKRTENRNLRIYGIQKKPWLPSNFNFERASNLNAVFRFTSYDKPEQLKILRRYQRYLINKK